MTVTIEQMRDKLIPIETARQRLAATEPLSQTTIATDGNGQPAQFTLEEGWDPGLDEGTVNGSLRVGDSEFELTKQALLEATSSIGLTKRYVEKTPSELIVPHLNFWFGHATDGSEVKALHTDDRILAFTKATIIPFSNTRFLDEALASFAHRYGEGVEVLTDYKFHHDLERTHVRLILPGTSYSPRPDDEWSMGVDIQNSLTGRIATRIEGYLFRWWCTNGSVTTRGGTGSWNRRTGGQGEDVYEWARGAVDEVLGDLEGEFAKLDVLAETPIDGEVNDVLTDLFETYRVPLAARETIIEHMVESDDLTMYGVMAAVTQAANGVDISENVRQSLLAIGGDIPNTATARCDVCHRLPIDH